MNARAIKKRMLKNAKRVFWGRRAFIGLRFPLDTVLPPKPPDIQVPDGFIPDDCFPGIWHRKNQDGSEDYLTIHHPSCSQPPDPEEGRSYYHMERNRWDSAYQWWEVYQSRSVIGCEVAVQVPVDPSLAETMAGQARDLDRWRDLIIFGDDDNTYPLVWTLMAPEWAAKTGYLYKDDTHYYWIWSVKYFYAYFLRRFVTLFKHSYLELKKQGVDVKVVDSEPKGALYLF